MRQNPNAAFMIAVQAATKGGAMPIAIGEPGMGKSAVMFALAEKMNRQLIVMIGSTMDPTDFGMPCIVKNDSGKEVVRMIPREFVMKCREKPTIIFMDEFSNTSPAVFSAELTMIQDRRMGDDHLPDDTIFAAAMNPADISANGIELPPPMANRAYHHPWRLDSDAVIEGYLSGLQFPKPEPPILPDRWTDDIPANGAMVAAFLTKMPSIMHSFPKDRAKQSGPYPTPRSWSYGVRLLAAAQSTGVERSISLQLLSGVVGDAAALQYFEYIDNLDIPDMGKMLDDAAGYVRSKGKRAWKYTHPKRTDQVIAMLAQLNSLIIKDPTALRWDAAMLILQEMADKPNCKEVIVGSVRPIMQAMPKGCTIPPQLTASIWSVVQAVMA